MKHIMLSLLLVLVWNLDAAVQVPVIWGANTANTSNSLLVSGEVNIYDAGGTTPRTIWTDKDETSAAANPYTLDARGSALLYTTSGWIHILVTDSAGTTVYDHDNILAGALPDLTGTGAYVISVKGDANDSYVKFDAASTDDYYLGTNTSLAGLVIRNLTDGLNAAWWDGAGNFVINENKEIQTATVTEYSATSDLTLSTTNASVVVKSATANVSNTGNVWVSNNVVIGEAWSAAPSNTPGSTNCLIMGTSNTAYQANNIICGTGNNVENISANYSLILGDSNENKGLEGSIIAGSRNNIFGNSNEGCLVVGYNNYAFGVCPSSANQMIMLGRNNVITSTGAGDTIIGQETNITGDADYAMGLGYEANVSSDYSIHLSCGNGALGEFTASTNHTICLTGGDVGINEGTPDISDGYGLHIDGKILRLEDSKTPASAGATGNVGEICWDADYLYICTAANTWERAAIATW